MALELAGKFIDVVLSNVRIRVGNEVTIDPRARAELVAAVTADEHLASGGRGLTTALESHLVNPLGRLLFEVGPRAAVRITSVRLFDGQPRLEVVHR